MLAVVAGVLSFISPRCLPLVPMYLSYLSGISASASSSTTDAANGPPSSRPAPGRWLVVSHAVCFVTGFALVFVALGANASVLGGLLRAHLITVRQLSRIVIVVLGLHTSGLLRLRWLYREWRPRGSPFGEGSLLRSALLGLAFGAGWTPCVGPILGLILLLGAAGNTLAQGVVLLPAYALGLGLPFLAVAFAVGGLAGFLRSLNRYFGFISLLSAARRRRWFSASMPEERTAQR